MSTSFDNWLSGETAYENNRNEFIRERSAALMGEYLADDDVLAEIMADWLAFGDSEDLERSLPLFFVQFSNSQADAAATFHRDLLNHIRPILLEKAQDAARREFDQAQDAEEDARAEARDAA